MGGAAIWNQGTVEAIVNEGQITAVEGYAIWNTGTITQGVINRGLLKGDVVLGTADLIVSGTQSQIQGHTSARHITVALDGGGSAFRSEGTVAATGDLTFQQGRTVIQHGWQGQTVAVDAGVAPGMAAEVVLGPNGVLASMSSTQALQIGGSGGDSRITLQNGGYLGAATSRIAIGAGGALQVGAGSHSPAGVLHTASLATLTNAEVIDLQDASARVLLNFTADAPLRVDAQLTGAGQVQQQAGHTVLMAANSYSGGTVLKSGRIDVGHDQALGTGTLSMDDGTTLGFVANGLTIANPLVMTGTKDPILDTQNHDATYAGAISGAGFLSKQGSGTLTLSSTDNRYTGDTVVEAGRLRAGATRAFSAQSHHAVLPGAVLDLGGFDQQLLGLDLPAAASVVMGPSAGTAGMQLTVTGPWRGGGTVYMRTALAGDGAISDRLVLDGPGAAISGTTRLHVRNVAAASDVALTVGDGILVVEGRNGASTTAQRGQDGFVLDDVRGYVTGGAFEYRLYPGDHHGAGDNWYLRNLTAPGLLSYRVEAPLLAGLPQQLRQADMGMLANLHQRRGEGAPLPMPAGRTSWARMLSVEPQLQQTGTVAQHSTGRLSGWQAGVDLYAQGRTVVGGYLGQLQGDVQVAGFASGVSNKQVGYNQLRNRYLGLYASMGSEQGTYLDAVLQGVDYRSLTHGNEVGGSQAARTDGRGWQASLEMGMPWVLGASSWQLEPQAQWVYRHMRLEDTGLQNARVTHRADSDWLLRLGARLQGRWSSG